MCGFITYVQNDEATGRSLFLALIYCNPLWLTGLNVPTNLLTIPPVSRGQKKERKKRPS